MKKAVSDSALYKVIKTVNEARGSIAAHAGDNTIHVTAAQKQEWDNKASQDDLDDLRKEMEGYEFRTVTERHEAYSVDVPAKVMPFASVGLVGGKSVVVDGVIKSADVKSIKGKNSISIPSTVRNIEGYGWSAGSVYNYIDLDRKVFVKRVGRVDLGTLSWLYHESTNLMYSASNTSSLIADLKMSGSALGVNCLTQKYTTTSSNSNYAQMLDKQIIAGTNFIGGSVPCVCVKDLSYSDGSVFKNAMSGVYLYYELATPIETPIDLPSNILQVEAGGTIIFEQEDGSTFPVPSEISYVKHLGGDA